MHSPMSAIAAEDSKHDMSWTNNLQRKQQQQEQLNGEVFLPSVQINYYSLVCKSNKAV